MRYGSQWQWKIVSIQDRIASAAAGSLTAVHTPRLLQHRGRTAGCAAGLPIYRGRRLSLRGEQGWVFVRPAALALPPGAQQRSTLRPVAAAAAKMGAGVPLTDADRRPWLEALAATVREHVASGQRAVLSCSALRERYRELLSAAGGGRLGFVLLDPGRAELEGRLRRRAEAGAHFMPPSLLASQLAALERPAHPLLHVASAAAAAEGAEGAAFPTPEAIVSLIIARLELEREPKVL